MTLVITQTLDLGDGTVRVTAWAGGTTYVSVVVGRDVVASGQVYAALEVAAQRAHAKMSRVDAHDDANRED